jgi:hypothetical protein
MISTLVGPFRFPSRSTATRTVLPSSSTRELRRLALLEELRALVAEYAISPGSVGGHASGHDQDASTASQEPVLVSLPALPPSLAQTP